METAEYALVVVNLVAGVGCGLPLASLVGKVNKQPGKGVRYLAMLVGVYFVECVAVVVGMGIPVFSVALAFAWGAIVGLWLRTRASAFQALKASFFVSLYTSLPAASFMVVPLLMWVGGWHVLSAEEGARFGIPASLALPWPLNTILGFYAALAMGAVVFKTVITVGEVSLLIHLRQKPLVSSS